MEDAEKEARGGKEKERGSPSRTAGQRQTPSHLALQPSGHRKYEG